MLKMYFLTRKELVIKISFKRTKKVSLMDHECLDIYPNMQIFLKNHILLYSNYHTKKMLPYSPSKTLLAFLSEVFLHTEVYL